ncbi:signal peptidase II [Sphingomonas glaciei]|uniref:Lipoprotein signal peptidase n=1 Tax=Sphingomonas glaciei TaxID=2938948 RepID=A0ABY5MZH9_9SPHN|nr:signal peptidase II [Sphingomonas glaciei]UUR09441.1 signal peptidase II [Sphingomonas glaciei]
MFVLDQFTKWLVAGPIGLTELGQNIHLLPFFDLTRVHNRGISLGLLTAGSENARWLLVAMTAVIAGVVAWWLTREKQRGDQLALGLVLGGALGNIVDRARLGYVFDFADLHIGEFRPFLVFNVADACISIGVVILILRAFLVREPKPSMTKEPDNA